jgi:hypothetical protein
VLGRHQSGFGPKRDRRCVSSTIADIKSPGTEAGAELGCRSYFPRAASSRCASLTPDLQLLPDDRDVRQDIGQAGARNGNRHACWGGSGKRLADLGRRQTWETGIAGSAFSSNTRPIAKRQRRAPKATRSRSFVDSVLAVAKDVRKARRR